MSPTEILLRICSEFLSLFPYDLFQRFCKYYPKDFFMISSQDSFFQLIKYVVFYLQKFVEEYLGYLPWVDCFRKFFIFFRNSSKAYIIKSTGVFSRKCFKYSYGKLSIGLLSNFSKDYFRKSSQKLFHRCLQEFLN